MNDIGHASGSALRSRPSEIQPLVSVLPVTGSANVAEMLHAAVSRFPARAAVIEGRDQRTTSFALLWDRAAALAVRLLDSGMQAGDRVAILLERGAAGAAAYFGVLAAGGAAVILDDVLRSRQIDHILRHSGALFLVCAGTLRDRLPTPLPTGVRLVDADPESPGGRIVPLPRTGGDMAHLIYTSGSTGLPKGVAVGHANVWAGMQAVVAYLGIGPDDRIASLLPFSFDYGLSQLLCAVATGATLVVERSPVPQRIVQSLFDLGVTVLPAVPPLWLQLLTVDRFRNQPLSSLRVMTNTGGRLPTTAVRALRVSQPAADLVLMYGLTEAFRSTYLSPALVDRKPTSMGRAIPGAEILVLQDDLTRSAPGEIGQLVHRGPTVTLGYWNNPAATRERFGVNPLRVPGTPDVERVVFSGDLVFMDEDGDLFFVGRRDAMIKSLGHRVSPDEVIDALHASGEIVEALITTESDDTRGVAIIAHVVLRPSGCLDRLKQHSARQLPRYMQPLRYAVHDALARTANGKHDCRALAGVVE